MSLLPTYLSVSNRPSAILKSLIKKWNPDLIAILVDENTRKSCLPKIEAIDALLIEVQSGETYKNISTCQKIWGELTSAGFSRKSVLITLGGGVIGDMGGFAASTYKRGIKFINVPTTLLSQADASIGGKLGVDFEGLKNHIGLFREPDHVIISSSFLSTLPERELKSGFSEVIKHSLIADKQHWDFIRNQNFKELIWDDLIPKSIEVKNKVVVSDPTENGLRKILNFGHTLGHALESHFLESPDKLLHGEAVAIGMILESHLSYQQDWLTADELNHIEKYIFKEFSLPSLIPRYIDFKSLLLQDKKNDAQRINFSLIKGIGNCEYDIAVSDEMIEKSITHFNQSNE